MISRRAARLRAGALALFRGAPISLRMMADGCPGFKLNWAVHLRAVLRLNEQDVQG